MNTMIDLCLDQVSGKGMIGEKELQPIRQFKHQLDHERQLKKSAWKQRIDNFKKM